ncbi:NifU family protein [Psychroflexus maritimus]|uniref:NifU family protein n=1 Tax=Psychroflexus maritimus TaxID=2714865 RepID=A0A967ACV1_9FLAO|nr:NifU family protein [Psychroflexus maritimus]NGZ89927.1 NifU family protein [Psychroflexus maritimus]
MNLYQINIRPTNQNGIVKFEANDFLVNRESFEFKNIEEAKDSPLAQKLFHLPFVKTVYITQNFIAIEKYNIVEWEEVQEEVKSQIENDLNNGVVVIKKEASPQKKIPVTVYAESTPNPGVQKFVANKKLVVNSAEFKNIEEAKASPLAQQLFQFPFVKEVFIDSNYVSVHKYDVVEWEEVGMEVRELIKKFLENNEKVVNTELLQENKTEDPLGEAPVQQGVKFEEMDDISQRIVSILDEYVKPAVASDGGNIVFDSYDENTQEVKVILQGACSGCPSSTMTLKNGIETMLKDMIKGKVSHVVAING